MKYYSKDSKPLVVLMENEIKAGDIVYNELGTCVKKVYVEDSVYFVECLESVLNEGETMSKLTPLQLELFWKLSNNKMRKHESQSKNSRR